MLIKSIIEFAAIVALIYGFVHEQQIAEWEQKMCQELAAIMRGNGK